MTHLTYTNRKGRDYHLCMAATKTGKPRYYFAREPGPSPVSALPEGREIRESINGVVSLVKVRPRLIPDKEKDAVEAALRRHPRSRAYCFEVQHDRITIYENEGSPFGDPRYMAMLRFILMDDDRRIFSAQRMCFRSRIDDWIMVSSPDSLSRLAGALVPTLGTDAFYELL